MPSVEEDTLPRWSTSFVGRTGELVDLGSDLARHRLVTLVGSGGAGKSRLAGEVARHLADSRPRTVWWVDLAPAGREDSPARAMAAALGLPDAAGRDDLDQLVAFLAGPVLLVLDNCEHVVEPLGEVLADLLGRAPRLVVLATSRIALALPGEQVREVRPLPLADDCAGRSSSAVALFLDRARTAQGASVPEEERGDVEEIVRRLDGLPLAIELAAAQTVAMTVRQLRLQLETAVGLRVPGPTRASSHGGLAACLTRSHDLLTDTERVLFRRLAVFRSGFGARAAAEVCVEPDLPAHGVGDLLDGLVGKSLVRLEAPGRYRLLETVREFATDLLHACGESDAVRGRHLDRALEVAAGTEEALFGANATTLTRLADELDDQRAALLLALADPDAERALRLATAMGFVLVHLGRYREAAELTGRALACPGGSDRARLDACLAGVYATIPLREEAALVHVGGELARRMGDRRSLGRAGLMESWHRFGEPPGVVANLLAEALADAEAAGDESMVLELPIDLAMQALRADDHVTARAWLGRCVPRLRRHGNDYLLAWALVVEAGCDLRCGEPLPAVDSAERAGRLARSVGEKGVEIYADYMLAQAELLRRRGVEAASAAERGLQVGASFGLPTCRGALRALRAEAGLVLGEPGADAALAEAVAGIDPEGDPWEFCRAALALARHRAVVGDPAGTAGPLAAAARAGRGLGSAWVAANVALVSARLRWDTDPSAAVEFAHDALALAEQHALALVAVEALEQLATSLASRDRVADGARLWAATADARLTRAALRDPREGEVFAAADHPAARAAAEEGRELTLAGAIALARRGRGPRARAEAGWDALTPAERDVAELAAQGLSNAAIAARLFVSPGTVRTHLSRIYPKLGVANRTELAAASQRSRT